MHRSDNRASKLFEMMRSCRLCPRNCGVNRLQGEVGACGIGSDAVVSSYGAHFGEESVLVGRFGSGTIFMTGCNLKCVFCQNYDISHLRRGRAVTSERLVEMMMELQEQGCHNINFVTPTHQIAHIAAGIDSARQTGLRIPIVYNCGGYESVEALSVIEGLVDIYMPDIKYGDNEPGMRYSGVPDYWDRCREAIREMHRQVGDLEVRQVEAVGGGRTQLAVRGLLVRHLVLPNGRAFTSNVARFLAEDVSRDTFINVMAQYRPEYEANRFPELDRRITPSEYREALDDCRRVGLHRFAD